MGEVMPLDSLVVRTPMWVNQDSNSIQDHKIPFLFVYDNIQSKPTVLEFSQRFQGSIIKFWVVGD